MCLHMAGMSLFAVAPLYRGEQGSSAAWADLLFGGVLCEKFILCVLAISVDCAFVKDFTEDLQKILFLHGPQSRTVLNGI